MKYKLIVLFFLLAVFTAGFLFWILSYPNSNKSEIFIKTGDNADSAMNALVREKSIVNIFSFQNANKLMQLEKVYPGKYIIKKGMTNRQLINLFKYGKQTDIAFRFGNNVLPNELYSSLGKKFEADSQQFANAVNNKDVLNTLGLDSNSVLGIFWSDTYQFPWSISPDKMIHRFFKENQQFWNVERLEKLSSTGLKSAKQAYILASIIEKEAVKDFELPIIAGVYINRLQIGMPLQADPTVKYAAGIKLMLRVKGDILKTESPYNTYNVVGLPPGPIGIATKKGVEAVLNFQVHDYLYFCAKEDFSQTHYFTKSYTEHLINAKKYRAVLNARGIQ